MKKSLASIVILLTTVRAFAQNTAIVAAPSGSLEPQAEPVYGIILPILFLVFLVFMLISLIKYFLEYRFKNKLIDRGMSEQLSAYLLDKNKQEQQNEVVKWAILFSGLGMGLILIYLTAPIHIHSLAIMALSLGLSYWVYYLYLRRKSI